ncbi:hypothetical protein SDC9_77121 [bioreactor metagenome]|uniref:Uncharacterized protein n=1 Tax=bioreactor metagenome TaxID=1076179 RepID=A0A644YRS3_9ZZZZ
MRGRIGQVGLAAKARAPFRHTDREAYVQHQRHHGDPEEPRIEAHGQNAQHQRHFDKGGQDAVERIGNQRFHALHAALDVARHAAGLAFQMKAQAQAMQVFKRRQRDAARRALRGLGEHQLAQFGEQRRGQAQQPVGQQQPHRHDEDRRRITGLDRQRIH